MAMNMIAKWKAVSTDRIIDLIFDKSEYTKITINGQRLDDEDIKNKEIRSGWISMVQRKLAIVITDYYN